MLMGAIRMVYEVARCVAHPFLARPVPPPAPPARSIGGLLEKLEAQGARTTAYLHRPPIEGFVARTKGRRRLADHLVMLVRERGPVRSQRRVWSDGTCHLVLHFDRAQVWLRLPHADWCDGDEIEAPIRRKGACRY